MFQIESLRPTDWTAAVSLALARVPESEHAVRVQQCLSLLASGTLDPRSIWVARQGEQIVGVQVCVPLAGKACFFWLPVATTACVDAVVQAGLTGCLAAGVKIAQATASQHDLAWAAPLLRNGFQRVTSLCQMEHDLRPPALEPAPTLRIERFRPALAADFSRTLERTYAGTLDCPELNGVRSMDEILAGHRGQGKFNPDYWWLIYDGPTTVGVVILVELADGLTWELAYLGVVPEFRRRGLGQSMMVHALHAVRAEPATRLTLAVDARNRPARRLYESLGFVEVDASDVLLYFFRYA